MDKRLGGRRASQDNNIPNHPKPLSGGRPLPPLWLVCLINGVAGLLTSVFIVHIQRRDGLPVDWWGGASEGLCLFVLTMTVQLWVRRRSKSRPTIGL